jgi:hypothetical protein
MYNYWDMRGGGYIMTDTSKSARETTFTPAKTIVTTVTSETHVSSESVQSVPTSRVEGSVKLRIASREMPDRVVKTTTK